MCEIFAFALDVSETVYSVPEIHSDSKPKSGYWLDVSQVSLPGAALQGCGTQCRALGTPSISRVAQMATTIQGLSVTAFLGLVLAACLVCLGGSWIFWALLGKFL